MSKKVKKTKKIKYIVTIYDNGDNTYSIPNGSRLKEYIDGSGEWVDASVLKITRLLQKGNLKK